jgi:hypothetical protein
MAGLSAQDFLYTNEGDTETDIIEGDTDAFRFLQTLELLELLGVDEQKRNEIIRIIAGILYIGQVYFQGDADSSAIDPTYAENAYICCELLGLPEAEFYEKTTTRKIEAEGQEMSIILSLEQAFDSRDALAKDIYDKLFLWLVRVVNASTCAKTSSPVAHHHSSSSAPPQYMPKEKLISLLDIFGFETFEVNHFEQLCINFANEKLQQKFTQDVFEVVQNEYKEEGLEWESIDCRAVDNSEVLDLLEGKMGIIALLNEECMIPKGSDQNFLNKITSSCKHSPCFSCTVHSQRDEFCIQHYAGGVYYSVSGFVERNRDALPSEVYSLMRNSTNTVLQECFGNYGGNASAVFSDVSDAEDGDKSPVLSSGIPPGRTNRGPSQAKSMSGGGRTGSKQSKGFVAAESVTTKFRHQLENLMNEISTTTVRYVRCIKPNAIKSSTVFTRAMVTSQLRCAGLIEAIRISRSAYPYRVTHGDFLARFGKLRPKIIPKMRTLLPSEQCALLLSDIWPNQYYLGAKKAPVEPIKKVSNTSKKAKDNNNLAASAGYNNRDDLGGSNKAYELGRTKVYFSSGVLETLERIRGSMMFNHITSIQCVWRGQRVRKWYLRLRTAMIVIQKYAKRHVYRQRYFRMRRGAIGLQTVIRRRHAIAFVQKLRIFTRASTIQSFYRMLKPRREFRRVRIAAIVLTAIMKMKLLRKRYLIKIAKAREDAQLSKRLEVANQAIEQLEIEKQELLARQEEEARKVAEELQQSLNEKFEAEKLALQAAAEDLAKELASQKDREAEFLRDQLVTQRNEELTALREEAESQVVQLRSEHATALAALEAAHAEQLKQQLADLREQMDADKAIELELLHTQLEGERDALKMQLEADKVAIQHQKDSEVAALKAELEAEKTAFHQYKEIEVREQLENEKVAYKISIDDEFQRLRAELEAEFAAFKIAETERLTEEFSERESFLREELESDKAAYERAKDEQFATDKQAFEDQQRADLEEQMREYREAVDAEREASERSLREQLDQDMQSFAEQKQSELESFKRQLDAEKDALSTGNEEAVTTLKEFYEEQKIELEAQKAVEIKTLREAAEAEKQALLEQKDRELKELEAQHDEQTRTLQQEKNQYFEHKEQETRELQDQMDTDMDELRAALAAEKAALLAASAQEIAALKEQFEADRAAANAANETKLQELRDQFEIEAKATADEKNAYFLHKEEERREMQEDFDREFEALREQLTAAKNVEIRALKEKFDAKILDLESELMAQKLKMEEDTRRMLSSLDDETKEQIDVLTATLTETLKKQAVDEQATLRAQMEEEATNLTSKMEAYKLSLSEEKDAEASAQLAAVQEHVQELVDERVAAVMAEMTAHVQAYKNECDDRLAQLKDGLRAHEKSLAEQHENEMNDFQQLMQQQKQDELEQLQAQLQAQLDSGKEALLTAQITALREEYEAALEQQAAEHAAELQRAVDEAQAAMQTQARTQLDSIQSAFVLSSEESNESHEKVKREFINQLIAIQAEKLEEVSRLNAAFDEEKAQLIAEYEDSIAQTAEKHAAEVDALNKEWNDKLEEELSAQLAQFTAQLDQKTQELTTVHAEETAALQQAHEEALLSINIQLTDALSQATLEQQQAQLARRVSEHSMDEQSQEHSTTVAIMAEQLSAADAKYESLQAELVALQADRAALADTHAQELAVFKASLQLVTDQLTDVRTEAAFELEQTQADRAEAIAKLTEELNESFATIESLQKELLSLQEDHMAMLAAQDQQAATATAAQEQSSEQAQQAFDDVKKFLEAQLQAAQADSIVRIDAVSAELTASFTADKQSLLAQHEAELQRVASKHTEELTRLADSHHREKSELEVQLQGEINALKTALDTHKQQLTQAQQSPSASSSLSPGDDASANTSANTNELEVDELVKQINEDKNRFLEFKNAEIAELQADMEEEREKYEQLVSDLRTELSQVTATAAAAARTHVVRVEQQQEVVTVAASAQHQQQVQQQVQQQEQQRVTESVVETVVNALAVVVEEATIQRMTAPTTVGTTQTDVDDASTDASSIADIDVDVAAVYAHVTASSSANASVQVQQLKQLLDAAISRGQLLSSTVIELHQQNELLKKEYSLLVYGRTRTAAAVAANNNNNKNKKEAAVARVVDVLSQEQILVEPPCKYFISSKYFNFNFSISKLCFVFCLSQRLQ